MLNRINSVAVVEPDARAGAGNHADSRSTHQSSIFAVSTYRPRSVVQLLLVGFTLVVIPLSAGLLAAFYAIDHLGDRSSRAIYASAKGMLAGQALRGEVVQMERHARQYVVLGDRQFYELALERRDSFARNANTLLEAEVPAVLREQVASLVELEQQIFARLEAYAFDSAEVQESLEQFSDMAGRAADLLHEFATAISDNVEALRESTTRLKTMLAWLASALILAAVALAGWLSRLIARPIKRVETAIRRLGEGSTRRQIRIGGPRDLEEVGERLEWLRKRLVQAAHEKTRFLRHVSHELKTPLTAIREGTELLCDEVPGPLNPTQAEVATILRANSLYLQRLIEDLIAFSTEGRSSRALQLEPVPVPGVIERVLQDQHLAIRGRAIAVRCDLTELTMAGDADKLRQVLDNLVSNAVKHSPRGGTVIIRVQRQGDAVVIDVRDQGPGIARDEREHVFEAFYQGRAQADGPVSGTGLGLAIAREYVEAHRGTIEVVESTVGAHLRVRIPLHIDSTVANA
jgi:two-component system sensor histidine kinase GlrK